MVDQRRMCLVALSKTDMSMSTTMAGAAMPLNLAHGRTEDSHASLGAMMRMRRTMRTTTTTRTRTKMRMWTTTAWYRASLSCRLRGPHPRLARSHLSNRVTPFRVQSIPASLLFPAAVAPFVPHVGVIGTGNRLRHPRRPRLWSPPVHLSVAVPGGPRNQLLLART
jgi:hypothetical protein